METLAPDQEERTMTPLTEVVERLQELVGDATKIHLTVHDAAVEVMQHVKYLRVLTNSEVGSWLSGTIEIGEHRIDVHSVTLQRPVSADAEQDVPV